MGVALECLSDNSVWLGYYTVWVSWFRQNFLSFSVLKELFPRILLVTLVINLFGCVSLFTDQSVELYFLLVVLRVVRVYMIQL